jgi:predicted ATPase/DNA-binding XRE family transcriptional regulator
MDDGFSFGTWLKHRRRSLDLTQGLLADRVHCSLATIQKIEREERRPSRQLAELLAEALDIPAQDRPRFLKIARGERSAERLVEVTAPPEWPLPTTPRPRLPLPPTPLIGREPELAELHRLMTQPNCRLVTIIGPGGIGKTRLALAAATAEAESFTDGAAFVPLAPLTAPEFIIPAIASALDFTISGPREPRAQLLNRLRGKRLLLVLDNLEHLLSDISILTDMLDAAPGVKLLATSRERLNLLAESVFDLQGLPQPPTDGMESIEGNSAVRLFVTAAQRRRSGFALSEQNGPAVARICRLVGGMPLALELAAARMHVLSSREIAAEIERSLDFLSAPGRDLPERHHSLRAVFDHSWRLLSPDEQRAMRRLSVFRGSFGREGAAQVAAADLSLLSALADKSLLYRTPSGRYELHELVRQYCFAKLSEAGEETAARQGHFDYYLSLAEAGARALTSAEWQPWLERLEMEYDNLRAALAWSEAQPGNGEPMLKLAGALYWFWFRRSDLIEGRAWLDRSLSRAHDTADPAAQARALFGAGGFADMQGDLPRGRTLLERSVAHWRAVGTSGLKGLAHALLRQGWMARDEGDLVAARSLSEEGVMLLRQLGDAWSLAYALDYLAMVYRDQTDFPAARSTIQESANVWRDLGDVWGLANNLHHLSLVELRQGDYEPARVHVQEALTLRERAGNRHGLAYGFNLAGVIALNQGELSRAKPYFQQCEEMFREFEDNGGLANALQNAAYLAMFDGDTPRAESLIREALNLGQDVGPRWLRPTCLARLAGLLAVKGLAAPAVQLWSAAQALTASVGSYVDTADRLYYERTIGPASAALDEDALEAARLEGQGMALEPAIQYALSLLP